MLLTFKCIALILSFFDLPLEIRFQGQKYHWLNIDVTVNFTSSRTVFLCLPLNVN